MERIEESKLEPNLSFTFKSVVNSINEIKQMIACAHELLPSDIEEIDDTNPSDFFLSSAAILNLKMRDIIAQSSEQIFQAIATQIDDIEEFKKRVLEKIQKDSKKIKDTYDFNKPMQTAPENSQKPKTEDAETHQTTKQSKETAKENISFTTQDVHTGIPFIEINSKFESNVPKSDEEVEKLRTFSSIENPPSKLPQPGNIL